MLRRSAAPPTSPDRDAILLGQLDRLITVAGWPNVTIQVLPYTAGIPPVSAGSFSVLESRATGAPDVVYLENRTRIFFVDAEPEVNRYARDFELLTEIALPPGRIHRIHPHHREPTPEQHHHRCALNQKSTTLAGFLGDLPDGVASQPACLAVAVTGARNFPTDARRQRPAAARCRVH